MKYYSTNHSVPEASLSEAVVKGLASDRGLFMPERIERLPAGFFDGIDRMSFHEIAMSVARSFFADDIEPEELDVIVKDTLSFPVPVVRVEDDIYSLELFHGPTLAFKDVGARFMARLSRYFISRGSDHRTVHVLVATSGDTGSAVANGFLGVEGVCVHVLYPKGKVSPIQECQFATLGHNITALEVDGSFDDCQRLVKGAFMDSELTGKLLLTSANSINVARFLPQSFYYFNAYARLKEQGRDEEMVVCVPSGNFGNLTAGLVAHRMGLPVKRFIAANNANDIFLGYLRSGVYAPRQSVATIANAMDVGDPSNFARILDLYGGSHSEISGMISGAAYDDSQIADTMRDCYRRTGYVLDPHGACAYKALREQLRPGEVGVFLETAHPAKFRDTVNTILDTEIAVPERLSAFMKGVKQSVSMTNDQTEFKDYLLTLV